MQDATVVAAVRRKYVDLVLELDERSRRRWAAVEARSLGRGGIATVATATGLSDRTIRTGLKELADPVAIPLDRQCRAGGGRKSHRVEQPGLAEALNRLIEPTARGTPMSPLRWTIKSRYRLADELRKQGFAVGPSGRRAVVGSEYAAETRRQPAGQSQGARRPSAPGSGRPISPHRRA